MGCTTSRSTIMLRPFKDGDASAAVANLEACPALLSSPTSRISMAANTPLHLACKNKQVEVVRNMLIFLSRSSVEVVQDALRPYCRRIHRPLPETVMEGVRVAANMADARGQTPLMYACYAGCPELVTLLLAHGADPWVGDRHGFRAAVHYAAAFGNVACVRALLENIPSSLTTRRGKRYIDAQAQYGMTPLHFAAYFGEQDVLRELLRHQPDLAAATTSDVFVTCEQASTALHFVAVRGDMAAARELLQYYARRLVSEPGSLVDPRTRANGKNQLPWQVAITLHPENLELAEMLHPNQTVHEALGGRRSAASGLMARSSDQCLGAMTLVEIAAAALRTKLVGEISALEGRSSTPVVAVAAGSRTGEEEDADASSSPAGSSAGCRSRNRIWAPVDGAAKPGSGAQAEQAATAMVGPAEERDDTGRGDQGAAATAPLFAREAGSCSMASTTAAAASGRTSEDSGGGGGLACTAGLVVQPGGGGGGDAASAVPRAFRQSQMAGVGGENSARGGRGRGGGGSEQSEEGLCELCFVAAPEVAPASCGHGVCSGCAMRLCGSMRSQPLPCPFCRKCVTGFVAYGQ